MKRTFIMAIENPITKIADVCRVDIEHDEILALSRQDFVARYCDPAVARLRQLAEGRVEK